MKIKNFFPEVFMSVCIILVICAFVYVVTYNHKSKTKQVTVPIYTDFFKEDSIHTIHTIVPTGRIWHPDFSAQMIMLPTDNSRTIIYLSGKTLLNYKFPPGAQVSMEKIFINGKESKVWKCTIYNTIADTVTFTPVP